MLQDILLDRTASQMQDFLEIKVEEQEIDLAQQSLRVRPQTYTL